MSRARFFVHVSAGSVEEMIDGCERHGAFVEARGYLPPSGRGVYGSVEIEIPNPTAPPHRGQP